MKKIKLKSKPKIKKDNIEKELSLPKNLFIKTCGIFNGRWSIVLSNGNYLSGVEEVISTKQCYGNDCYATIKVHIPGETISITKDAPILNKQA